MAKNVRLREKDFEDQLSFLVKDNDDYNDEKRDGIILERGAACAEMERKCTSLSSIKAPQQRQWRNKVVGNRYPCVLFQSAL